MALPEHTVKDWKDTPSTQTPLSASALEDLESRLADHATDSATEAITQAAASLATHGSDTTGVHGIADTTALALKTETTAAIATAAAYTDTTVNAESELRAEEITELSASVAYKAQSWPTIVNPAGLDRWRAVLANAGLVEAHMFEAGDSRFFGEHYNGSSLVFDDATCSQVASAAVTRALFAEEFGDPGEGFIFPGDDRVTSGGGITTGVFQGPSVLRINRRFTSPSHTLTLTIPSGRNLTRLQVIQANGSMGSEGTVPGTGGAVNAQISYTKNGGSPVNLTAPTNTGAPIVDTIAVTGGDVIVLSGPASGQNTVIGFVLRTAQTTGVVVHRMGRRGYTSPNMLGGVFNGVIGTPNGTNVLSAAQQTQCIRSIYQWSGASAPFVIMNWGTNEVTRQLLSTGIDCGVTPALYRAVLDRVVKQVTADGGCVLLSLPSPSPITNTATGAAPLSAYAAMAYSVAMTNRHCAMVDLASRSEWYSGGFAGLDAANWPVAVSDAQRATAITSAATNGLRDPGSSHETAAGYELNAEILHEVLTA